MVKFISLLAFTASVLVARANYGGVGTIQVWNTTDTRLSTPEDKVGCLDSHGKFINPTSDSECGVFSRLSDYPYTLSTSVGNCTFGDESQEKNTDSKYGRSDHAWNCLKPFEAEIYDEFYTIAGFQYVYLCSGNMNCYFDAKNIPANGQRSNVWPFRWGSQQLGITPGHVMLNLIWNQISDLPKTEDVADFAASRTSLKNGPQTLLRGPKILD